MSEQSITIAKAPSRSERLTDSFVQRLQPDSREYAVHDSALPGLAIRISPRGAKTWIYRRSIGDRLSRVTLGRFPAMNVSAARTAGAAGKILGRRALPDVTGIRKRTPLFSDFAAVFVTTRAEKLWAASTVRSFKAYLRHALLPAFGSTPVGDITRPQVMAWFHEYSRTAPGGANQTRMYLHQILKSAADVGHIADGNALPSARIRNNKPQRPGRALKAAELERLGEALARFENADRPSVQAIKLILLTGARVGEILPLKWSDWSGERLAITGKTGKRTVFLGRAAQAHLDSVKYAREFHGKQSVYVFPSVNDTSRPLVSINTQWKALLREANIDETYRLHDLRHTFASLAVQNGESLQVTGRMLGHARFATTERYAHLDDAHIRKANQTIADAIERAVLGE